MTRRLQPGTRLLVASHNAGKVREIADLVRPHGLAVVSAAELALPEPEETGATFKKAELALPEPEETGATFSANAEIKALAAAKAAGLPALADDSGLEVEVLGGAPGIYSARWAGPTKDFKLAMQWLADEVRERNGWQAQPGPRANFTAALCLAWPDGACDVFEGKVYGHLVWPAARDARFRL